MTESQLQRKVLRMIKLKFKEAWFYKASDKWVSGIPDILGCLSGRFFAIELKVGRNKPTPIQLATIDHIRRAGGDAAVCYTSREVEYFLKEIILKEVSKDGKRD